jgi:biotin-(acetyl-CoA carboxylase) ligase
MSAPSFPPLMSGLAVTGAIAPFDKARAMAALGCDAGLVVHNVTERTLAAALVMAPEVPLAQAMAMLPACGVGFQNALGALAPPEVAVHLEWAGGIRVNGARCGRLRVAAGGSDPAALPGWLVVGLEVPLAPETTRPGDTRDETALLEEGCAEVAPLTLLEAWARHTLVWINAWEDEGVRPLHEAWRGLAWGMGEPLEHGGEGGTWLGVDEDFGMILRTGDDTTRLVPLTSLLETSQ